MRLAMNARPVFLVDHDPDWCARVCRFLEPHGISVVTARDIDTAVELASQLGKPSALVMDMSMRRENGRAVSTLRSNPSFRDVEVGYVKKSAALDALLMMVMAPSTAAAQHCAA